LKNAIKPLFEYIQSSPLNSLQLIKYFVLKISLQLLNRLRWAKPWSRSSTRSRQGLRGSSIPRLTSGNKSILRNNITLCIKITLPNKITLRTTITREAAYCCHFLWFHSVSDINFPSGIKITLCKTRETSNCYHFKWFHSVSDINGIITQKH
jgi:hypothetical protein